MQYLAEGHWPLLDTLILTANYLDGKHFALLANSDWPLLHTLRVSYEYLELSAFPAILSISQHDVMVVWGQVLPNFHLLIRQRNSNFWPRLREIQAVYIYL